MKSKKPAIMFYSFIAAFVILLSHWGSRAVTVIAENTPLPRKHCIIIDPGHGGEDGGAISCTGIPESTYNLDISLRLRDLFHLLGYDTKLLRTDDVSIYTKGENLSQKKISDLKERVRIVNETQNGILLSIHQNHFSDSRYSGAQVFFAPTSKSEALAKLLQTTLASSLNPGNNRQIKKCSGVYLMEHIQCTGILIECGFLSNPAEAQKLRDPEYQKKLCAIIASATDSFLSNT